MIWGGWQRAWKKEIHSQPEEPKSLILPQMGLLGSTSMTSGWEGGSVDTELDIEVAISLALVPEVVPQK